MSIPLQPEAVPATETGLASLQRTLAALLLAMRGPDLMGRMQALRQRLDNGLATRADLQMLASLPPCQLDPDELVRLFVRERHLP